VEFLNRVKSHAEEKGVPLCVEIFNDKYQNPSLGRVRPSPRVRVLFDIYHVQIMDGNVVENMKAVFPLIAHFHTAGVPGRHEIDENQELNYPFILTTIADMGYTAMWLMNTHAGEESGGDAAKVLGIADV